MVATAGLAPARPIGHSVLNTARLLFHHAGIVGTYPRTRTGNIAVLSGARLPLHQVGVENWYAPRDSNPDCAGFKAAASAVGLGA
jgi:hypothetical protein